MREFGQFCLLAAFVSSGYAAFACLAGWRAARGGLVRTGYRAAALSFLALTATICVLGWALVSKDFRFDYVAHYSSRQLPWSYSLSALWVGQAGSLLLWSWMLAALGMVFRFGRRAGGGPLKAPALALVMANVCFLAAIMVFAADPMKASLDVATEGLGLSPLLQHPSMLIHPPVIFLGYAAWTIPFALAMAALFTGRLDDTWIQHARPWALLAWTVLGAGVLLGADWAYQELGWGGYWSWDPVENGSLVPWLTGTALIHGMMAWRRGAGLKRTTLLLAIVTFGLCNFATFLTRSGIFSSVHAFSDSPVGWMFLGLMVTLFAGGVLLIVLRRGELSADRPIGSLWSREAFVLLSAILLALLTLAVTVGTLIPPLSAMLAGRTIQVGTAFYNDVLTPIGLTLLALTAAVPLLRWGRAPGRDQRRALLACSALGAAAAAVAFWTGVRHPVSLAVAALAAAAISATAAALLLDGIRRDRGRWLLGMLQALRDSRRQYAGYLIHLGLVCLAVGVTGSSLGSQRMEAELSEGDGLTWAGRRIRYVELVQRELPDKLVAEAVLDVSRGGGASVRLTPARHLHLLQDEWTTEVAIDSAWSGDFYAILNAGLGGGRVSLTFVVNPMMRWIWLGGLLWVVGAAAAIWPLEPGQRAAMRRPRRGTSGAVGGAADLFDAPARAA